MAKTPEITIKIPPKIANTTSVTPVHFEMIVFYPLSTATFRVFHRTQELSFLLSTPQTRAPATIPSNRQEKAYPSHDQP